MTDAATCPTCGRPLDEHNRHVRFQRPDAVFAMSQEALAGKMWGDDPLLAVQDVGFYVRAPLPIKLTGGYTVTFGIWLSVDSDAFDEAVKVWHAPEYMDLKLEGALANALPAWGAAVAGKRVRCEIRDAEEIPYICASDDALIERIIGNEWPHDNVLPYLPPSVASDSRTA